MSIFTEFPQPSPLETYASTNDFARAAIDITDASLSPFLADYTALTQWLNHLPSTVWRDAAYLPMTQVLRGWSDLFFAHRAESGLFPSESAWAPRKRWDGNAWVSAPQPSENDARTYGIVETADTSSVGTIGRMAEFLNWFSTDATVVASCCAWADAFRQSNYGANQNGHLVRPAGWTLYNFVHAGPPAGAVPSASDPFETQLRWSLEGLPDSWWCPAGHYATVASSFSRLSLATGDATYANVAAQLSDGLWNARILKNTFLVHDTITPQGPLPGDLDALTGSYMHDTDSLYWANGLYDAYAATGAVHPELTPQGDPPDIGGKISLRRGKIDAFISTGPGTAYPARALGLALAVTIDWIQHGWNASWQHFVRKIYLGGGPAVTTLYGDGPINTLQMLVNAYRFTHDAFYLDLFSAYWFKMLHLSHAAPEVLPVLPPVPGATCFLHGLIPSAFDSGVLSSLPQTDSIQDVYLDLIVKAYKATVDAATPRPALLASAALLARRILSLEALGYGSFVYRGYNGLIGSALFSLAYMHGTLRRVGFDLVHAGLTLTFQAPGLTPLTLSVPAKRAVVYMDDGLYTITSGVSTFNYLVAADAEHVALPF